MRMRVKMTSLLMAVILFISAFSGSAYAAETTGAGMSSEGEEVSALEEETSEESVLTEDAMEDLTISESEIAKDATDTAEESSEEEAIRDEEDPVTMYTITLNANGGYFENEWDDILREYVEKEEVVNKMIKPGEAVKAIPIMEREDAEAMFLGWSLEKDGELIPHSEEEYTPEESCVLFAVWEIEERAPEELDAGAAEIAETEDSEEAGAGVTDTVETEELEEAGVGATDATEYAEPEESGLNDMETEDSEVSDIGATNETEYANPEEPGIASTEMIEEEVTETVSKEPEQATAGNFTLTIYAAEASLISSNNGDFGHAWLSITNNMSTPYNFYGYFIEPGCSMDLGLFGDQTLGDSGLGGVFLNRESCVMREPKVDCYSVDVSIEAINKIRAAVPAESYYHDGHLSGDHVYNDNLLHNCTTFAVKMWNLAVGYFERFNYDPITLADMPSEYVALIRERNFLKHGKLITSTHYSDCSVGLDDVFHVNKEGDLIPAFPLYIEPEDVHVMVGESASIEARFHYTDSRDDNVNWKSSDPGIAKVVNGQVVGYKRGTCTITASLGKYQTAQCVVKVMDGSIYTVEELKAISSNLSGSYVLMNDLDLGNEEWTPIGSASNPFTGEFDGNGHSISGLKITGKKDYQGLFGKIKNAKISRLRVYGTVGGNMYVGAIAGEAENSALSYCVNYATVVGVDQVGGVIGRCYRSSMDYCMNAALVSGSGRCVGGIAADIYPSGWITHCLNTRIVSGGYDLTGGIVGGSTSGTVDSCVNAAAVHYVRGRAGVIAGDNSSYSGKRTNNYFLRTNSVNNNFPIYGTGGGTFTSVSDSIVTDLKNAILTGSEGKKQDWPLEISLSLNKVNAGDEVTVIVKGCNAGLSFKSSDSSVATVSSTGIVTTKKVGKVKITVTAGRTINYNITSKSVTLDVYPKSPDEITAENLASGIKLSWTKVSDATRYYIYRDEKLIKTIKKGSTVTFTDKTVKESGKFYTYKVTSGTEKGAVGGRQCYIYRLSRPSAPTLSKYNGYMFIECKTNEAVDGFHIQLTEDKNFEKGRTTYKVAATTISGYITNLSAGKRYYVRVRTYVSKNGQVYCSAWSKGKSLKLGSGSSKKVTATKGKSTNASSANTSSSNASSANVRIKFSGTQTMATGTSRRIYVEGAGTRSVNVTSSSSAVRIRKDSKSYIVTANGAGTSNVTVTVGGTKKRFQIVVLSDRQIAERVWAKVKTKYKYSDLEDFYRSRDNKLLYVTISTPQGDGLPWVTVKVNLSTGRADCGESWKHFLSKLSKTFLIW